MVKHHYKGGANITTPYGLYSIGVCNGQQLKKAICFGGICTILKNEFSKQLHDNLVANAKILSTNSEIMQEPHLNATIHGLFPKF